MLLWLVPSTVLWHLAVAIHPHNGYLPSALCSLTIILLTHSFASSLFLLQLFPVPRSRARWELPCSLFHASSQASACAASSSPHCHLWLTCAPTEGLFRSLLVIHRVWRALQMNRSHNCSVLEEPSDYITVFALLCLLQKFIMNFCVLLGSVF